jgi:hypothetical protein
MVFHVVECGMGGVPEAVVALEAPPGLLREVGELATAGA